MFLLLIIVKVKGIVFTDVVWDMPLLLYIVRNGAYFKEKEEEGERGKGRIKGGKEECETKRQERRN